MKIERTSKTVNIYPKVKTGEEENLKNLKSESLSIEKSNDKVSLIQRGYTHQGRGKLTISLGKEDLKSYITELQHTYDELYGTRLNRPR